MNANWLELFINSSGVKRFRPMAFCGNSLEQETSLKTRSEREWWENKRKRNLPEQLYYRRHISPARGAESFPQHGICFGRRTNTEQGSDILQRAFNLSAPAPSSCREWSRWILTAASSTHELPSLLTHRELLWEILGMARAPQSQISAGYQSHKHFPGLGVCWLKPLLHETFFAFSQISFRWKLGLCKEL